jgi:hypothetical protein
MSNTENSGAKIPESRSNINVLEIRNDDDPQREGLIATARFSDESNGINLHKAAFNTELEGRLHPFPNLRPFIGNCHPLEAEVIIVGCNAATLLSRPFTDFWDGDTGFDLVAFDRFYGNERKSQWTKGEKPRHKSYFSRTRQRINTIVASLPRGARWIATNVYWTPTECQSDLKEEHKVSEDFKWLLRACRPRVILAHGDKAYEAVRQLVATIAPGHSPQVEDCSHLGRCLSKGELAGAILKVRRGLGLS